MYQGDKKFLRVLADGPMTVGEIAERLRVTAGYTGTVLRRLEAARVVSRDKARRWSLESAAAS